MQPESTFDDLPSSILKRVKELCQKGVEEREKNDIEEAIYSWERAIQLLPEPREEWKISCWLFTNTGEMYFQQKDYEASDEFFRWAISSPGGSVDSHINMRLGQSCFKLGQMEEALEFLLSAISIDPSVLDNEPNEYREFLSRQEPVTE